MHEKIYSLLTETDDITWQATLYELVKSEGMDPWDIDVSMLAQKFVDKVRQMKHMDIRVSGKMVLTTAILLKIKSKRLIGADLDALDKLFAQTEESDEDLLFEEEGTFIPGITDYDPKKLIPRTPQPRKRKVSIYDLMGALQKAMEVKKRKVLRDIPPMEFNVPEKKRDIGQVIKDIYGRIKLFFVNSKGAKLTFSKLIPENPSKEDKVFTFVPLLHLTNQRKIDLAQQQHFGEIEIQMLHRQAEREVQEELEEQAAS